ncbi:hypothetical protein [Paractinoplanes durhamensis]|uniref:Uncharacterized protein n=1 Tax=Paractinoplanes durhamensis TaxID=113563 RepID=A0ABQ3YZ36_9ACTN|nr:hypothetical protein [Actinoplanes durhamensis]GIE02842.1 hypothetical protein Adu01nite_41920 [Actinoplanes durhamensis]
MDRGPAALFGAIVAVGLGPAMWLGVRLSTVEVAPSKPPAVVGEHTSGPDRLVGGTGAGDSPLGDEPEVQGTPRGKILPLTRSASPTPSVTSTSPSPAATSASPSSAPATDPQSTPPTESTTTPATPPTESTTRPTAAPDPPPVGSSGPAGPGAGLTQSGESGGIAAGSALG